MHKDFGNATRRIFPDGKSAAASLSVTLFILFAFCPVAFAGPSITGLMPTSGGPIGGYKLKIHGSGFIRASHVTVGGKICALKSQSVSEIECIVPAYSPVPKPGSSVSVPVVVTVGGLNSNSLSFSYVAPFSPFP